MADEIRDEAATVYRDYVVGGVPASGENEPAKSAIRALFGTVQDQVDDLVAGQSAGVVAAETWAALSGYATGGRVEGDYGKVVGTDAGTHTDPVVGGTVDNEGLYRWASGSPSGWKRVADLDADDAAASKAAAETARDEAVAAASSVRAPRGMHTDGMLRQWLFDDGSGDTVVNILDPGTGDIDLTLPTNANVVWSSKGVKLSGGLVQAGSITGARTVATLYRVPHGATGMILSGGSQAGAGVLTGGVTTTYSYWVANGSGIAPLTHDANGAGADRVNRGGWLLLFAEFDQAYDTALGWGGIHSDAGPDYRFPEYELAWAGVWDDQLTDDERDQAFLAVRRLAKTRDIYLHWEDCPDYVDSVLFWGQSGVTGYSVISEMTDAAYETRVAVASNVLISHLTASNGEWLMAEPFQFKYNHRAQGLIDSRMGPLPGAAWAHEDNHTGRKRKLLVVQSAQDSTALTDLRADSETWNVGTLKVDGMLWAAMRHWWTIEQSMLMQGIGPRMLVMWYFQGEEDSIDTDWSETYGDNLADLWTAAKLYLGAPSDFTMKLVKTPVQTPAAGFDTAANDEVRAAQIAFAAAQADVELIDCDDLAVDAVEHFTGQSSLVLGQRLYAATDLD